MYSNFQSSELVVVAAGFAGLKMPRWVRSVDCGVVSLSAVALAEDGVAASFCLSRMGCLPVRNSYQ
jgi:hypothetical protein